MILPHPELEISLHKTGMNAEMALVRATADLANIQFDWQKEMLGLKHARWREKSFVGQEHFVVILGDDIMYADIPVIRQLIEAAQTYETSVVRVQFVSARSPSTQIFNETPGRIFDGEQIVEKPKPEQVLCHFGVLCSLPRHVQYFRKSVGGYGRDIPLSNSINILCTQKRILAVDFVGNRYDVGNLKGYVEVIIDHVLRSAGTVIGYVSV